MLVGFVIVFACFYIHHRVCCVLRSVTFDGDGRCAAGLAQLPTLTTATPHKCVFSSFRVTILVLQEECEMKTIKGKMALVK